MPEDFVLRPRAVLRAEGWNNRRLRTAVADGELVRPVRGFYGSGEPPTGSKRHLARARAIAQRLGTSAVLSHHTTALVHGLPLEFDDPDDVHLTVAPPARGGRRSGYHMHVAPLPAEDVVEVDGLRVTSLARTAADLARVVPYEWGVAAMDVVLRRGITRDAVQAVCDASKRRAGVETLRAVIGFAHEGARSAAESISRVTMARAGVPAPVLQYEVTNESGWLATTDFAWPEFNVIGEVDGDAKVDEAVERGQKASTLVRYQQDRDEFIRRAGWWPTHWGWKVACDPHLLGERIRAAFAAGRGLRRG